MTREELEAQMADYLTGEMPAEQRADFERLAAADAGLARELADLRKAQSLVATLPLPAAQSRRRAAGSTGPRTWMRFAAAAAIFLAFLAGFAVRGLTAPSQPPAVLSQRADDPTPANQAAVLRTLTANPTHSDLTRSLLALAAIKGST